MKHCLTINCGVVSILPFWILVLLNDISNRHALFAGLGTKMAREGQSKAKETARSSTTSPSTNKRKQTKVASRKTRKCK